MVTLFAYLAFPYISKYFLYFSLAWTILISYTMMNIVYKELNYVKYLNT